MTRHYTHLHEFEPDALLELAESSIRLKREPPTDVPLLGKQIALCFMNPSLRTRVSFEIATASLGGYPLFLSLGADTWKLETQNGVVMDGSAAEHAREAIPVLARYCDALALRAFPAGESWDRDRREPMLSAFREYSPVPVINMESATCHPCQALADLMTIRERMDPRGKNFLLTWAPHTKGLPLAVPQSAAEIAAMAGMNVTIARPEGFDLAPEAMARIESHTKRCGSRLRITADPQGAYKDAQVVYAKSWMSLDQYGQPPPDDPDFRKRWRVDAAKMAKTADAFFMHCLPVRRNLVVTEEVLDDASSAVLDQAENRLHTAKAVLLWLLGSKENE